MDPRAGASCVKHDPKENPAHVDGGFGVMQLGRVVGLGLRVQSLRDDFGCRVQDVGDVLVVVVGRHAGMWDCGNRVGNLRQEVFRVGGVLPVAVKVGDVAVVSVVSPLREGARGQEPQEQREERNHGCQSTGRRLRTLDGGGCWRKKVVAG